VGSLVLMVGILARPLGGILRRHVGLRPLLAASLAMNVAGCFTLSLGSASLRLALIAVLLIGFGCGLPYAAMFSRAGALFRARAGAAMGLVNMLGILMILIGAPLVGRLADLGGNFRLSFVLLGTFSAIACAGVPLVGRDEPGASL